MTSRGSWKTVTHDWSATVDHDHLADIRARASTLAPDLAHLVLEVLAYAAEEAEARGGGRAVVTHHRDGTVSVADDGRGTDTRPDGGRAVRKPIMATRDVRFFDTPEPPVLPDGVARRGMSVVAALSTRLVHLNRRADGAWTQAYERGVPVTGLDPVPADGSTGTTVTFLPDRTLVPLTSLGPDQLRRVAGAFGGQMLQVVVHLADGDE
ncbi:ATP-binding protein [Antribacter sp. KLBMP9083]|uniref:DNA topoisomerase (ATP-hydrolyzing) n=1 Tax=Antribacter soli TaxID=2910976 RepID=A0AA41QEU0_9MICO|nr:ATP-binding protein [Antribacter soli]MCF4121505.1 ATP-binding protein [Antribacter soli]